jgi:hypothetical protein
VIGVADPPELLPAAVDRHERAAVRTLHESAADHLGEHVGPGELCLRHAPTLIRAHDKIAGDLATAAPGASHAQAAAGVA